MKPFERGTDGEFIERMQSRGLLSTAQCEHLAWLIASTRVLAKEHKLRATVQEAARA